MEWWRVIKRYFNFCIVWLATVFGIAACTNYHVEQNSNNGPACRKGGIEHSILGDHSCSIDSKTDKESKQ